jgi:hypothetical protein
LANAHGPELATARAVLGAAPLVAVSGQAATPD